MVETFLESIELIATVLEGFDRPFTYDRDPDDAVYVNLALAANARLIVSRDRDLLDLTDPAKPDPYHFRERFPSLHVVTPVQFMREYQMRT